MDVPRPALLVAQAGDELRASELAALEAAGLVVASTTLVESADRPALRRLAAEFATLAAREEVDEERVALLGLGQAATLAFLHACQSRGVAALVLWGGELVRDRLDAQRPFQPLEMALGLEAPLLAQIAGRAPAGAPERVELIRSTLSQFARSFELEVHPASGDPLEAEARVRALAATLEFLAGLGER